MTSEDLDWFDDDEGENLDDMYLVREQHKIFEITKQGEILPKYAHIARSVSLTLLARRVRRSFEQRRL